MPEIGLLRLNQIIGQREISLAEARENKRRAQEMRSKYPSKEKITDRQKKELAKQLSKIGPRTVTPAITPIVPWSKSKLWEAVKQKQFPAPVKLSERTTAWTVQSVREFCQRQTQG